MYYQCSSIIGKKVKRIGSFFSVSTIDLRAVTKIVVREKIN